MTSRLKTCWGKNHLIVRVSIFSCFYSGFSNNNNPLLWIHFRLGQHPGKALFIRDDSPNQIGWFFGNFRKLCKKVFDTFLLTISNSSTYLIADMKYKYKYNWKYINNVWKPEQDLWRKQKLLEEGERGLIYFLLIGSLAIIIISTNISCIIIVNITFTSISINTIIIILFITAKV